MRIARFLSMTAALIWIVISAAPGVSSAQSRLTLLGSGLVPFGDLEDIAEPSLGAGVRLEYQPVNALGKRRLTSFFIEGNYTPLILKSEVKEELEAQEQDTDSWLGTIEGGIRVYSRAAALFLQAGAGFTRWGPPGGADHEDGVDFHAGAGFLLPIPLLYLEADATVHQVLGKDDLSYLYVVAQAGVSLPF